MEAELSSSFRAIKKQSEERKVLLQEIHHRVKNNLQIISSMVKLQAANSEEKNRPFDFNQTVNRINAISLIHEMIYKSETLEVENIESYIRRLIDEIIHVHSSKKHVHLEIHVDIAQINLKTFVPISIIINELVINSIKHGFQTKKKGND